MALIKKYNAGGKGWFQKRLRSRKNYSLKKA